MKNWHRQPCDKSTEFASSRAVFECHGRIVVEDNGHSDMTWSVQHSIVTMNSITANSSSIITTNVQGNDNQQRGIDVFIVFIVVTTDQWLK